MKKQKLTDFEKNLILHKKKCDGKVHMLTVNMPYMGPRKPRGYQMIYVCDKCNCTFINQ